MYSLHKTAQAWRNDPAHELAGTVRGAIVGYLLMAFVVALVILGALGVLAFGPWFGGPYVLAKVLFFLGLFPLLMAFFVLGRLLRFVHRTITGQTKPRTGGAELRNDVIDVSAEVE